MEGLNNSSSTLSTTSLINNGFQEVEEDSLDIFSRPARLLICGSSDVGKSHLTERIILKYSHKFDVILICGVSTHPLEKNPQVSSKLVVSEEIVSPLNYKTKDSDSVLLVLDDCYKKAVDSELVCNLFTRGRHSLISVIFVTQNIFSKGKHARDITLNASHIIMLRTRDISQVSTLARQIFGVEKAKEFITIYKKLVLDVKFGYVLVDLTPYTSPQLQIRTFITDEKPYEVAIGWD